MDRERWVRYHLLETRHGKHRPTSRARVLRLPTLGKAEREAMEKSSLMYVRKASASPAGFQNLNEAAPQLGLGLATGTRLLARLESAASTAVRVSVLAVIEYNYERDGEIIVPAGAKAVGHIREANRSGYVDLQFDSLLMPDGASVPNRGCCDGFGVAAAEGKGFGQEHGKERPGQIAVRNRPSQRNVRGTRRFEPAVERVRSHARARQQ